MTPEQRKEILASIEDGYQRAIRNNHIVNVHAMIAREMVFDREAYLKACIVGLVQCNDELVEKLVKSTRIDPGPVMVTTPRPYAPASSTPA